MNNIRFACSTPLKRGFNYTRKCVERKTEPTKFQKHIAKRKNPITHQVGRLPNRQYMLTTFEVLNVSGNQNKVARREKMPKEKTLPSYYCTLLHFEKPRGACLCVSVCIFFATSLSPGWSSPEFRNAATSDDHAGAFEREQGARRQQKARLGAVNPKRAPPSPAGPPSSARATP